MLKEHPTVTLPADQQLDVASALFAEGSFTIAAKAYELYLQHYRHDRRRVETAVLLAVLYVRKERNLQRAQELLDEFEPRIMETSHQQLVANLRNELAT